MNKVIITTTINSPTEALVKFSEIDDWDLVIIGDLKTPDKEFESVFKDKKHVTYLSSYEQSHLNKDLSDMLGWNNIQRRNFGFWYGLQHPKKYEIFATVDDDNIPYLNWGKDILIGKKTKVKSYSTNEGFFDPIFTYTQGTERTWHRGFPEQLLNDRKINLVKEIETIPLIQADLWSGDPDISAVCRMANSPDWKYEKYDSFYDGPFTTYQLTPFNSQNTFLDRSIMSKYMMICDIGRYDDIWGAYLLQKDNTLREKIVFNKITVHQKRNEHDLVKDLKNEIFGYENTIKLDKEKIYNLLPDISKIKYKFYINEMQKYE